jgi:hypothetical protein
VISTIHIYMHLFVAIAMVVYFAALSRHTELRMSSCGSAKHQSVQSSRQVRPSERCVIR